MFNTSVIKRMALINYNKGHSLDHTSIGHLVLSTNLTFLLYYNKDHSLDHTSIGHQVRMLN
jgi:hypothetical protein